MRGLCGTLTWNQRDDFTTPEGDVENSVTSFVGKFTTEHCALPRGAPTDACSTYTQRRQYAETVCAVVHSPIFQVSVTRTSGNLSGVCLLSYSHMHLHLWHCRCAMTWWRGSRISASACQKSAAVSHREPVTALFSRPTPDTVLRKVLWSSGATTPSAVGWKATGCVALNFGNKLVFF